MGVGPDGDPEGPGQPEVGELDEPGGVDQQVLGLEVPVEHPVLVAVAHPLQQLPEVGPDQGLGQAAAGPARCLQPRVVLVHQLLEVHVEVLEHQVELLIAVHHVQQLHHGRVVQLLEEGDLPGHQGGGQEQLPPDGGGGHPLRLRLQPDPLEGDALPGGDLGGPVHHAVRALPNLLHLGVVLHPRGAQL